MKTFEYIISMVCGFVLLCSCDYESETVFLKRPVDIDLHIFQHTLGATKVYIEASPAQDEVYYIWDVVPQSRLDNFGRSEKQYMELVVDGLYAQYINWRHDKLESGEPFIGNFANQYMSFGQTHYFFTELTPDTDYCVWAFCVNSSDNKPMGDLHKLAFHTQPMPDASYRSPMVIDFEINRSEVLIVPSVEDVDDYYAWDYISERDLASQYHGSLEEWALATYTSRLSGQTLRNSLCRGIIKDQLNLSPGETYIVAAAAYDANFEKALFTRRFTYDDSADFKVERGHDE